MILPAIANTSVNVLTYPTTSDHGANVTNYAGTPTTRAIPGCSWQPADGSEVYDRQDATLAAGKLYLPAGAGIDGTSVLEVEGKVYQVVGDPADHSNAPFGLGHVVAILNRWEG
jgi:hypothetical protein